MKFASDEDLNKMEQDGKYEWRNREITEHSYSSGGTFTLPELKEEKHIMFQCLKCKSHFVLEECENCSNTVFTAAQGGVFCRTCEQGFSSWTCPDCDTKNPAKRTLFLLQKKGGCFVATTVYGSYDAKEVIALRSFRDNILLSSYIGQFVVNTYYFLSPLVAKFLRNHRILKKFIRISLLNPIVNIISKDEKEGDI